MSTRKTESEKRLYYAMLGFGIGLLLITSILFFAHQVDIKKIQSTPLSDEAVIERAEALGMVWPEDDKK